MPPEPTSSDHAPPPPPRLDIAPGIVAVSRQEMPPLPDAIMTDPAAGRLDPREWFRDPTLALEVEIGCGKGTFIVEEARARPDANFLGFEWEGEYFAIAADRARRAGLTNVRMLHADAVEFLKWRMPDALVRTVHLYFSDPWPKTKHHKNRVVQDGFLAQVLRVLTPGGELRVVTDHGEYWAWMQEHFARWAAPGGGFQRRDFAPPASAGEGELVGTNFERKYRREGRPFHAVTLRRPLP